MLKLGLPTTDEFFATERWKLQPSILFRQLLEQITRGMA